MAAPPSFDARMSDAEGLMWRLEKDPALQSSFANVTILDRPIDVDRLRSRLARAVEAVPRLHQRVQPSVVSLTPPTWVDDTGFDLDFHVRHVALPQPGTLRQLLDLATLLANDPFDRTRPLWEFTVVDGLEGGRGALLQKMHHTITDGEGGVRMSLQFLDLERDPEPPASAPPDVEAPEVTPTAPALDLAAWRDLLTGALRMPIGLSRQLVDLMTQPQRLPDAGTAAVSAVRALTDVQKARSPLWTQRSLRRHLEVLRTPIEGTKDAAKTLGGTLNTAFMTAAATAAGQYHRELGAPVDMLRASMAVSTRGKESGANAFGLVRIDVPTGPMPIAERFARIHEAATRARSTSKTGDFEILASLAATLPTSLITRIARSQTQTVDFATSNVRAARFPLFIAGAKILENYPIGPTGGVAFNLTLLSYAGSLDMGLNCDRAAIAEPERLRALLDDAFEELRDAAGAAPAS